MSSTFSDPGFSGPAFSDPALSRLAHGVLWPGFVGTDAPDWLLRGLESGLAGAVVFAPNIESDRPDQIRELSNAIHAVNPHALIGVDEEGGIVTRLEAAHGSSVPGNAALGRIDDVAETQAVAEWIGRLVASAGIDIDLAPTVDVNSNPLNPVIGVRSFSADPAVVARHAAAYVRGIQDAGVAACAKHFPGHGDTITDSHLAAATSDVGLDELHAIHLRPFVAAIEAGVKAIMSAHIRIPVLGDAPATINSNSLRIARDLGFSGVIVTDALDMAAIRATLGTGRGAVAALNAGADLLCIGNPNGTGADEAEFSEPLEAIYAVLTSGELAPERVEQAIERNRALAAWRREQTAVDTTLPAFDGAPLAARAIQRIGDVSLTGRSTIVVDARTKRNIAVGDAPDFFTLAIREHRQAERVSFGRPPATAALTDTREAVSSADDVVLLVNQPQSSTMEASILEAALESRPDAVVIYAGWPALETPRAARALVTYGAGRANARAAADILCGSAGSRG